MAFRLFLDIGVSFGRWWLTIPRGWTLAGSARNWDDVKKGVGEAWRPIRTLHGRRWVVLRYNTGKTGLFGAYKHYHVADAPPGTRARHKTASVGPMYPGNLRKALKQLRSDA